MPATLISPTGIPVKDGGRRTSPIPVAHRYLSPAGMPVYLCSSFAEEDVAGAEGDDQRQAGETGTVALGLRWAGRCPQLGDGGLER